MGDTRADSVTKKGPAVTCLAVANFVLGGLRLGLSVLLVILASGILGAPPAPPSANSAEGAADPIHPFIALLYLLGAAVVYAVYLALLVFVVVVATAFIVVGVLLLVAGVGLLQRRRWARTYALVLGALGGGLALLYLAQLVRVLLADSPSSAGVGLSLLGLAVHGGYAVATYAILLNRKIAAEFA